MSNWNEIWKLTERFFGEDRGYFWIYLIALVYIMIFCKEERKRLALPSLAITVFVLNPITHGILEDLYWYWRLLWMIPVIPVVAVAAVHFIKRFKPVWIRGLILAALLFCIAQIGNPVYRIDTDPFTKAENRFKIPQKAIDVADALLEMSDEPRVVMPSSLYCYIRQYTTKIHMMYGRDAEGYIASGLMSEDAEAVYTQMGVTDPNLDIILGLARENGYEFVVSRKKQCFDQEAVKANGFEQVAVVGNYEIYRDMQ